jgi:hypothetical protein
MKLLTWADISLYVTEEFALVSGGEVKEKAKVGNKVETEIPIIAKIIATKKGVNTVILFLFISIMKILKGLYILT